MPVSIGVENKDDDVLMISRRQCEPWQTRRALSDARATVNRDAELAVDRSITFGPFRLFPAKQILLEGEKRVRLGSRALQILTFLAERPGQVIAKEELVAYVWSNIFVEEGNLRVHMAALRRALGHGQGDNQYIATVPGRGYRFIESAVVTDRTDSPARAIAGDRSEYNLPARLARMVGRDDVVAAIVQQMPRQRFITIAGPGGIGKTTVALAVAEELSPAYRDGARFIDFAPVADPQLVVSTLASVFELLNFADSPLPAVIAFLRDKEMLLLFDNCDHVIEVTATLAEEIYKHAPRVHILATSREKLRVEGERVLRLLPLGVPTATMKLTAKEALAFPAIQLFVERVAANSDDFKLEDADAPQVAEICRRLDGMALAIELAAASVDTFGINGLASGLNDRFRLLTRGRRTALPRHQTLSAMLDWSYEFLPAKERAVLRRLAIFAGPFDLSAAQAIEVSDDIDAVQFADIMVNLVAKSLVTTDVAGKVVRYRLLETTRAYGLGKLKEAGEAEAYGRRHAEYYRDLFVHAESEWEARPTSELLADYAPLIDNVRAALDWAFSPGRDPKLGISLTIAAQPVWRLLSLMAESRSRTQRALDSLQPLAQSSSREILNLLASLGAGLRYDKEASSQIEQVWTSALTIAENIGDVDYQMRCLSGLRNVRLSEGNLREALSLARRFKKAAEDSNDPTDRLVGDRMIGYGLHFMGDLTAARRHIENVLGQIGSDHRAHIIRFVYDQRVLAYHILAEVLWLQGYPDQAMHTARCNVDYAQSLGHELSLCNALGQCACPIALFVGDLAGAERYIEMLLDHSTGQGLPLWHATGRCFDGVLRIKQGDIAVGLTALRTGLDELLATRFITRYVAFLAELAEAYARAGEIANAQATIDEALERCHCNQEFWYLAELLRIKGKIILKAKGPGALVSAEAMYHDSLNRATEMGALSWALRTATGLARLYRDRGDTQEARHILAPVYGRFTEGSTSADFVSAKSLLDSLL
jgi:predicted ATPase/DNA-binding winged helix-turn-helix (wHTH) protein